MDDRQPDQPREEPSHIGPYEIQGTLGSGGMSVVYRAIQPSLEREVAIKVLSRASAADPEAIARFERESTLVAGLSHPGIIQIFDRGREGDSFYIVMEYVRGCSLEDLLRERDLDIHEIVDIASQVGQALAYAHSKGVVHRDIKPGNILVSSESGASKVADFGIALLSEAQLRGETITRENIGMGTLNYMAPEQRIDARGVDRRADIYAFGVIVYEMLTKKLPLGHFKRPEELRDDTPPSLSAIVLRCLQQSPEDRYQTFDPLLEDLSRVTLVNVQYRQALARVAATVRRVSGTATTNMLLRAWRETSSRLAPRLERRQWIQVGSLAVGVALLLLLWAILPTSGERGDLESIRRPDRRMLWGGAYSERFEEAAALFAAGNRADSLDLLREIRKDATEAGDRFSAANAQWEVAEIHREAASARYAAIAYSHFADEFGGDESLAGSARVAEAHYWAGHFRETETRPDYEAAVAHYRSVYTDHPGHPRVPESIANAARLMHEKIRVPRGTSARAYYELVAGLYRRVIDEFPESPAREGAYFGYADLHRDKSAVRDYARAAETFEELERAYPGSSYEPLFLAAELYDRKLKDDERAIALYSAFLESYPGSRSAGKARSRLRSLRR
ncbi:MAG: protein kinase domain-containing protein [Myxococcota bacterium]